MSYVDIHIHALFGVDDGAKTEQEMLRMVDAAYAGGTRMLCLTPHYHPGYFGENREKSEAAFRILQAYAAETHPDLELYLGNELRYSRGCVSWLDDGLCRTMGNTNRVLVDFSATESIKTITGGIERLLNGGYMPVLAHVERYAALKGKKRIIRELRDNGVLLQVDSLSLFGAFGMSTQFWAKALLGSRLADAVASDAHDLTRRPPTMDRSYSYIARKYGTDYADAVCRDIPRKLVNHVREEAETKHG